MALITFHKIVVAFDGSPNSIEACELATIFAKGYKAEVIITHVLPPITTLTAPMKEEYETSIKSKSSIEATKMTEHMSKEGIEARTKVIQSKGSVADSLVDFASNEKADLIVAGTRGLGAFRRMVLGSVSTNLLNQASCPVLVVRKVNQKAQTQLRRILVATDGSKSANSAVEDAVSIAKAVGASLTITHVVYLPPLAYSSGTTTDLDKIYDDLRADGERIVSEASKIASDNDVTVTTKIIDNNRSPVFAVTKFAEEGKFDLIVLGTRGLGGIRKVILGSVANGVVHYAKCSVLVAK